MDSKDRHIYPAPIVVDLLRLIGYVISKTFWLVRYHGRENIPDNSGGGFLICSNHQTYIDPVWICLPMRRKMRFMATDTAFSWRIIGPLIRYLGSFPVSPEVGGTVGAMKETIRSLREGAAVTVFPEGARAVADGKMLPFKTGAVRIAIQAGVPILPVTISGGERIWPQKQRYPRLFRRVEVTYHPLMYFSQAKRSLEESTAELKKVIGGAQGVGGGGLRITGFGADLS